MVWITPLLYLSVWLGLIATTFYLLSYWEYRKQPKKYFSREELPSVTVLIPAYNEEQSIGRTIETILRSEYPMDRFEVIVIDDGSKDKTLSIAQRYASDKVSVLHQPNGGKGSALNRGIRHAQGEIIFTVDADTYATPQTIKRMVQPFVNPRVMGVTPGMLVYKPKGILQRVQHMEYLLGIFLRKAFATLHSVYITPGAFSCYRKTFFDTYGGYDEHNITEDIEISLRIQYQGYFIDNVPSANAYTIAPDTFKGLMIQRRRWYFGYIRNVYAYRALLSKKYGDLGLFVIPIGVLSILFSLIIMLYLFTRVIDSAITEARFILSNGVDYSFFDFNRYALERSFFEITTNPIMLSIGVFVILMGLYLWYATRRINERVDYIALDLGLFFFLFAILFGFWWTISVVYALFSRSVKWR